MTAVARTMFAETHFAQRDKLLWERSSSARGMTVAVAEGGLEWEQECRARCAATDM